MTLIATEKVTKKVQLSSGAFVYDQCNIDYDQQNGTVTAVVTALSVNQGIPPADPGKVVLETTNAAYVGVGAGYQAPAKGYAQATPEPSGAVVDANRKARGF